MTSRERVRTAIAHQAPDRVPIDFGSTAVTGMHVSCVAALRDYYGLPRQPVKVHEPYQMLGTIEEDLKQVLGVDVDGVSRPKTLFGFANHNWKEWRMPDGLVVLVSADFNTTTATNGDILIYPEGDLSAPPSGRMPRDGYFFDTIIRQPHLDDDSLNVEDNLEEFQPISAADLDALDAAVSAAEPGGRFIIMNAGGTAFGDIALVPAPFLKHPKGIRDVTEWYMSIRSRRDYIHQIFSYQCDVAIASLERVWERIGSRADALFVCGTDFGTQSSTFCSTDTFLDLFFPYYRRVNDWIHSHTTWKTFKHSCGSVERFIPAMIDAGFDILNPVQCSAKDMAAEHLKRTYGSRIAFWGGGVDTQQVLPFGTPEEVRSQVLERCQVFSENGGFVFNSIHNVQARTPVENIVAMIGAVQEFNAHQMGARR